MPDQTDETSFPIRNLRPRLAKSFPELTEMTTGPSKRPMQQPLTNYFRKRPKDNPSESNEPQRPYDFETDDPYMVENVSTTWTEEFEVIEPELTGIDFTPRYYFHFVLSHLLRTTFGDALGVPDNSDFGDNLDNLLEAEDNETDADVMTSPLWVYLTRECNRVRAGDLDTAIKKGQFWIVPDDPSSVLRQSLAKGLVPSPDMFYHTKIFIFDPSIMYPEVPLCCPACHGHDISVKGWVDKPRRIVDVDECYYLFSRRMHCKSKKCNTYFTATDSTALSLLPTFVTAAFPCRLTKRSGVSTQVVQLLNMGADSGMGPQAVWRLLRENHTLKFQTRELLYYNIVKYYLHSNPNVANMATLKRLMNDRSLIPKFGAFSDRDGYSGFYPSGYILSLDSDL